MRRNVPPSLPPISLPGRRRPPTARYLSNVTRRKPSPLTPRRSEFPDPLTGGVSCAERSGTSPIRAVILPGSASDDVFVRSAFAGPLRAVGITLFAPSPRHGADVVEGYRAALDAALDRADAAGERLLVGGVSLGAHVAATWAADRAAQLAGLLLALPAWSGPADGAPAALAARATADLVRSGGVAAALDVARAGSPPWLAAELGRAWPRYGAGLAAALDAAAAEPGPDAAALGSLTAPAGIAALVDDPVHPIGEARRWQALLPRAVLHASTLAAFGADSEVIGRAAVLGWLRAGG